MLSTKRLCGAVLATAASHAMGQTAWFIIDHPTIVTPTNPEIEIELNVGFDYEPGIAEAYAAAQLVITSSVPRLTGGWAPPGFGLSEPAVQPTRIVDVAAQIHFPKRGIFANADNPIHVYTFAWRAEDFTPHWVTIDIRAIRMDLYNDYHGQPTSLRVPNPPSETLRFRVREAPCYADCDTTTGLEVLDLWDFLCFGNRFAAGDGYACDCDTTTGMGVCDVFDALCFLNAFAAGCE